ncbi:hypothetical protein EJB05_55356, partial [Eragrostis curvula]
MMTADYSKQALGTIIARPPLFRLNRSRQNSQNIAQQEMKSLVGTKSIMQIAYELREPATAETEPERIASVAVPLAEHFALVMGRKPNHSRGVGVPAVNQDAQERHRLHAQAEIARQHADNAREHAAALEAEVQRLTQANMQLQDDMQSQREELASQRRSVEAQNADVERLMDQKLEERMNALARITAHNISAPNSTSGNTPSRPWCCEKRCAGHRRAKSHKPKHDRLQT